MASLFILPPRPRMKMPAMTAISSAMAGVPRKSMSALTGRVGAGPDDVGERVGQHQHHRDQDADQRGDEGGPRPAWLTSSPSSSAVTNRSGTGTGAQRAANVLNSGPGDDHGRDGDEDAEGEGEAEVGAERGDRDQRARVRRHQAVHRGQAGQGRDGDLHQRQTGTAGHQDDHRHQQHEADLEEHRQPDERADQRHRPGQRPDAGPADQGVDDPVGTAGVGQQLAVHRAETDQHADAAHRVAEALGEGGRPTAVAPRPGGEADPDARRSSAPGRGAA